MLLPRLATTCASCALLALGGCAKDNGLAGASSDADSILGALFETPTPTDAVTLATDPYNADNRQRGVLLLANAPWGGEEVYLDYYRLAIADEDAGVRIAAARALAMHGEPEDVPALIAQARDEDDLLRREVARALQRLHNPEAIPTLLESINEEVETESQVRAASASALGQYAERRVVDRLIDALRDKDLAVNTAAFRSLETLTGQDLGLDDRSWTEWARDRPNEQVFAGRTEYRYPVFYRDPSWLEVINPFDSVPNEISAPPVGMPPVAPTQPSPPAPSQSEG